MKKVIRSASIMLGLALAMVPAAGAQLGPTNLRTTQVLSNQVSLQWDLSAGAIGYHVWRRVGGAQVRLTSTRLPATATTYDDGTAQPSTTYEYWITAVFSATSTANSQILTVTTPAPFQALTATQVPVANLIGIAQATPKATSGRYRISIAGFKVNRETYDDPLERDGKRDEVYTAVVVQHFNRKTGALVDAGTVQSKVHGDANGFPDRVPQGRASGVGGLMTGDVVPSGWDEQSTRPSSAPGRFPLVLWEGSLANEEDALVLRPTIWEWDGDHIGFNTWLRKVTEDPRQTWNYPRLQQTVAAPIVGEVVSDIYSVLTSPSWYLQHEQPSNRHVNAGRDRPIGLTNGFWPDRLLVLTREKIKYELSKAGAVGGTRGLVPLRFADDVIAGHPGGIPALSGDYTVYLRLEQLP